MTRTVEETEEAREEIRARRAWESRVRLIARGYVPCGECQRVWCVCEKGPSEGSRGS